MYFLRLSFLLIFYCCAVVTNAQQRVAYKEHRVLVVLDASASMVEPWFGGASRFKAAGQLITSLMDSVYRMNKNVEFSLRVYGHQYGVPENNCYDTRNEVMFSRDNLIQMSLRLEHLRPYGVSPIALSLQTAVEKDMVLERDYTYSLLLITDGGESCGGDICAVVRTMLAKKIQFRPYIVSLTDDTPLKDQYQCLGTYLTATSATSMAIAIDTIARHYRQALKVRVVREPDPPPAVAKTPVVSQDPVRQTPPPVTTTPEEAAPVPTSVTPPPEERTSKIMVQEGPEKEHITTIYRSLTRKNFPLFWSTPGLTPRTAPALALPVPESGTAQPAIPVASGPAVTSRPVPRPVTTTRPAPPEEKESQTTAQFTTTATPAEETMLELYFTNGQGKYYQTNPPVRVVDSRTGQQVKRFYRTVDPSGNPDPQPLPAGNYTLLIGKRENFIAREVQILPDQRNKITIRTVKGTLSFAYGTDLTRPMSEFTAVVKKNFEPGPLVTQPCDKEVDYETGNYHIEINTLPVSRRNIDLDFGSSYRIDLDEPGFVQITNTRAIGKISLYYQLGDQFVRFHVLDVTGNTEQQKLRLQPGRYEVHYRKNPEVPTAREDVVPFGVKSNFITDIMLPH